MINQEQDKNDNSEKLNNQQESEMKKQNELLNYRMCWIIEF